MHRQRVQALVGGWTLLGSGRGTACCLPLNGRRRKSLCPGVARSTWRSTWRSTCNMRSLVEGLLVNACRKGCGRVACGEPSRQYAWILQASRPYI